MHILLRMILKGDSASFLSNKSYTVIGPIDEILSAMEVDTCAPDISLEPLT
jgi:hypothetical protein